MTPGAILDTVEQLDEGRGPRRDVLVPQPVVRPPADLGGDDAVAWLAARQHGVVAHEQLRAAGLSAAAIAHRVQRGRLHRLHRGVYAAGRPGVPAAGVVLAAILAVGTGAVASHHSAARLLAVLPAGSPARSGLEPVHVAAPLARRSRPGVRAHRMTTEDRRDLAWIGPVPVTSAARTVLDLAATDGRRTAERVLAEALRTRRTTESAVRSLIARSRGHHGVGIVARLIHAGPAFDRSVAERRLLELLRRAGLPQPRLNARVGGWEVDALWSELSVVVEVDSWTFHGDLLAFRKDRRKSAHLQSLGYAVVAVTWADLTDHPEVVVANIAAVVATARARRG